MTDNQIKLQIIFQSSTAGFSAAPGSFLFSFSSNDGLTPFKCLLKDQNNVNAIYRGSAYGPSFGFLSADMEIADNAGSNTESYAKLGNIYEAPDGYVYNATNTNSLLGGSEKFTPSEVEVLYLI